MLEQPVCAEAPKPVSGKQPPSSVNSSAPKASVQPIRLNPFRILKIKSSDLLLSSVADSLMQAGSSKPSLLRAPAALKVSEQVNRGGPSKSSGLEAPKQPGPPLPVPDKQLLATIESSKSPDLSKSPLQTGLYDDHSEPSNKAFLEMLEQALSPISSKQTKCL